MDHRDLSNLPESTVVSVLQSLFCLSPLGHPSPFQLPAHSSARQHTVHTPMVATGRTLFGVRVAFTGGWGDSQVWHYSD